MGVSCLQQSSAIAVIEVSIVLQFEMHLIECADEHNLTKVDHFEIFTLCPG